MIGRNKQNTKITVKLTDNKNGGLAEAIEKIVQREGKLPNNYPTPNVKNCKTNS